MNVLKGGMVKKKNSSHSNLSDPADFSLVLRIANLSNYVKAAKSEIFISLENIFERVPKNEGKDKRRETAYPFSPLILPSYLFYQKYFLLFLTHYDPRFCSVPKQKQPLTYFSLFRNLSRTGSTQKRKGGCDTFSLRPPYTQKETPGVPLDWVPRRFLPPYKQLVLRQACVRAKFVLWFRKPFGWSSICAFGTEKLLFRKYILYFVILRTNKLTNY
jgi:hypothetical protein